VSDHGAPQLTLTLALFVLVYAAVFGTGMGYLGRLIRVGPKPFEGARPEEGGPGRERQPMRPLSASTEENDLAGNTTSTANTPGS
jgi:cytochrome d ubiquinol oxidase subunit I